LTRWHAETVGFCLIVAIYVQVAMLFGVYTPELFPTDVRLRANGALGSRTAHAAGDVVL